MASTGGDLSRRVARMLMIGFEGLDAVPDDAKALIDAGVFGAILFKRNVGTPEQTAALCHHLKEIAGRPFTLAVDQEGGRVARLRGPPFTAVPPMRDVGATGDEALAERTGRLLAQEISAVGFDWDFAPVVDVDTNPKNPVIGDRSFGRTPELVSRMGVALARGLEAGGVASCAKHFPGHGDTSQDSHLELPSLPHDMARLRAVELPPFRAYAQAGLSAVMTAHVIFQALDPEVPATLSEKVLKLLRQELGFGGVLVSDDLEMKAIADHFGIGEAAVRGTLAGVDLFLVCHRADRQNEAIQSIVKAVEDGRIPRARIDEANARLDALERRFAHPPADRLAQLSSPEHQAFASGLVAGAQGGDPTERWRQS
ncbi:MAG TPA: beta-N-acetylhexosaminidase [Myxococcaceae bacterium]|nr:beta-N-acetylhexosaminidase [Myxococcaceae bacterium]